MIYKYFFRKSKHVQASFKEGAKDEVIKKSTFSKNNGKELNYK